MDSNETVSMDIDTLHNSKKSGEGISSTMFVFSLVISLRFNGTWMCFLKLVWSTVSVEWCGWKVF